MDFREVSRALTSAVQVLTGLADCKKKEDNRKECLAIVSGFPF
jgi:hypothetical protein